MNEFNDSNYQEQTAGRPRILIVEDDMKFCRLTSEYLKRHGYEVTPAHDGEEALRMASSQAFDAIILDIMLPGIGGYDVLRRVREYSQVPVLVLTALGDDERDRIVGLEIGADDYLPKTFSPRELLARLRAVLRRTHSSQSRAKSNTELTIGPLIIDLLTRTATLDGEFLVLTPVEFDLLLVLAQARGRTKTREQLLNDIRDRNYDLFDRSIDVHISSLRKKLQDDPKKPRFIQTVRSVGYVFLNPTKS